MSNQPRTHKLRRTILINAIALTVLAGAGFVLTQGIFAQDTANEPAPQSGPVTNKPPIATVNQLMRGLFFPLSNVVFSPQLIDPATIAMATQPSMATDPLDGAFGQWQAVENSALMLIEGADLLEVPGRVCSNGLPAPVDSPEWKAYAQEVRNAAKLAYDTAKAKDLDKMLDVSAVLNDSCANCHGRYRRRNRCQQ